MKAIRISLLVVIFTLIQFTGQAQEAAKWSVTVDKPEVKQGETFTIKVKAAINEKWHIYSATPMEEGPVATSFEAPGKSPYKIKGKVKQPKPIVKFDENFQVNTEFFEHEATFTLTGEVKKDAKPGEQKTHVEVSFMACNDRMCLPPATIKVPFTLTVTGDAVAADETTVDGAAAMDQPEEPQTAVIEQAPETKGNEEGVTGYGDERDVERAKKEGFWAYIGLAMSVGALALLTPCVFPMIPITVSFFTKREAATRGRSIRDALVYSFGIMFTFTGLGILLAVIFGAAGINQFAANPWMNILISLVFIIFALNLFGMFEIVVPSSILTKLNTKSNQGSGIISILLMALTFTLTSFTCTVPFVGTVMVAAASGEIWWSVAGMMAFSAVFALPFFLLALFPSWLKSLPKSGGWLNSVKVVMGFLELAAAMKFLSNVDLIWGLGILNRDLFLAFWVGIGIMITVYILGKITLPHDSPVERLGAMRVLYAVFFLGISVYLYTGLGDKPLGELDAFLPPMDYQSTIQAAGGSQNSASMPQDGAKEVWLDDYQKALAIAKEQKKPVFIDFTGFACTNCRWMESNIFTRSEVKSLLKDFVLVKLYTDGQGDMYVRNRDFQQNRFGTVALPLYVVMSADDKEISRFPGMTRQPTEFVSFLEKGKGAQVVAAGM